MQVSGLKVRPLSAGWPTLGLTTTAFFQRIFQESSSHGDGGGAVFLVEVTKARGRKRCNLGPVAHQANCKTSSTSKTNELLAEKFRHNVGGSH